MKHANLRPGGRPKIDPDTVWLCRTMDGLRYVRVLRPEGGDRQRLWWVRPIEAQGFLGGEILMAEARFKVKAHWIETKP